MPLLAGLLTWLCAQTLSFQQFSLRLDDAQQGLVARTAYYDDALIIDIDDGSLARLQPHLGAWPYSRSVYGLLIDYLSERGAKTIVLDIQLTDPRVGDDQLAQAIRRHDNTVLIGTSSPDALALDDQQARRLGDFGWAVPPALPATRWPSIVLPAALLTESASHDTRSEPGPAVRPRLGIVSVQPDADGLLRRLPLVHAVGDLRLPSLPLVLVDSARSRRLGWSASAAADANAADANANADADADFGAAATAHLGAARWPIDAQGHVRIAYPRNANAVLYMPLRQVAEAALGLLQIEQDTALFRGKTVFIGSTANTADRVATPLGTLSGTQVLAIAYENLAHGQTLAPRRLVWDVLQGLLVVGVVLLALLRTGDQPALSALVMLGGAGALAASNAWLLWHHQQSLLLAPLLMLGISWGLITMLRTYELRHRNLGLARETSELVLRNARLEAAASTDALTGLLLRRAFEARCAEETAIARRHHRPLSVAMLDVDHFKKINDTHGHPGGDLVLKVFAALLSNSMRASEVVGRWGGEEFIVLLPETTAEGAYRAIDSARSRLESHRFDGMPEGFRVTVSAGVAEWGAQLDSLDALVAAADGALYAAKRGGRNRVVVHVAPRAASGPQESGRVPFQAAPGPGGSGAD